MPFRRTAGVPSLDIEGAHADGRAGETKMFESAGVVLAVLLPFLIIAAGLLAALAWAVSDHATPPSVARIADDARHGRPVGTGALVATWLVLTGLTLWCGYVLAFVVVHALLFTFGSDVALVGLVVSAAFLIATPIAWGLLLRRQSRAAAQH